MNGKHDSRTIRAVSPSQRLWAYSFGASVGVFSVTVLELIGRLSNPGVLALLSGIGVIVGGLYFYRERRDRRRYG